jgi:hypothetical protein
MGTRNKRTLQGSKTDQTPSGPILFRAKGNPTQGEGVSTLQLQIRQVEDVGASRSKEGHPSSNGQQLGSKIGRDQT